MSNSTELVRDSSLWDRKAPGNSLLTYPAAPPLIYIIQNSEKARVIKRFNKEKYSHFFGKARTTQMTNRIGVKLPDTLQGNFHY